MTNEQQTERAGRVETIPGQFCGVCEPRTGPYTRDGIAAHLRDVHRNLAANGSGPPGNTREYRE